MSTNKIQSEALKKLLEEKKDFYQAKCDYYQKYVELSLVAGCFTSIAFIFSDYLLNGSYMSIDDYNEKNEKATAEEIFGASIVETDPGEMPFEI